MYKHNWLVTIWQDDRVLNAFVIEERSEHDAIAEAEDAVEKYFLFDSATDWTLTHIYDYD